MTADDISGLLKVIGPSPEAPQMLLGSAGLWEDTVKTDLRVLVEGGRVGENAEESTLTRTRRYP